jgi:hypothetical protein
MKKPATEAPAGWYDDPETEGQERFWNGKYWSNKTCAIGEARPDAVNNSQRQLGKFLFRTPYMNDGLFIAYLIISGITTIYLGNDYLNFASGVVALVLLIPSIAITCIWIYILFLIILVPRRILDKRNGLTKAKKLDKSIEENLSVAKFTIGKYRVRPIPMSITIIFILVLILGSGRIFSSSPEAEGDKYFEVQQRITKVVGEWNVAATPISEAVQLISNGEMSSSEARQVLSETSSKFAVIHNKLDDECLTIPKYDLNSSGFKFATAKAYDALKVTCDLLPQQSVEILALVNQQISLSGTQAGIDYHLNQITMIVESRRTALFESMDALEPYLTEAQKQTFQRLRNSFQ